MHQRVRRLPAFGVGSSAIAFATIFDPDSRNAQLCRLRSGPPRRRRRGVDSRRPYQTGGPSTSTRSLCRFYLTSRCSALRADAPPKSRKIPQASSASLRPTAGMSSSGVDSRCHLRVATLAASRHACHRTLETKLSWDTAWVNRSSPPPIANFPWRPRRRIVDTNRSSATADWTLPIAHMEPDSVTSPSPPRQKRRERH